MPPKDSSALVGKSVTFHYLKSNFFRVIHADGAWGGISPTLNIQMAIFSERVPIPQQLTQEILPDKSLGKGKPKAIGKEGIVRELEADIVMDLEVAKSVYKWLGDKINIIEGILKNK